MMSGKETSRDGAIKAILFDWGDTLMVDFPDEKGPMKDWRRVSATRNAEACLAALAPRFPLYVATNAKDSGREDIMAAFARVGLAPYLSGVFCFREIGAPKPSKEFFGYILGKLGLSAEEILMVGDDLEKDYRGARSFGLRALLYDPRGERPEAAEGIQDLSALPLYLGAAPPYN
jgi:FMN phosphatase YigB (HAD superfamily)